MPVERSAPAHASLPAASSLPSAAFSNEAGVGSASIAHSAADAMVVLEKGQKHCHIDVLLWLLREGIVGHAEWWSTSIWRDAMSSTIFFRSCMYV